MQTAYPLGHLYRTTFNRSEDDLDILRQFFKTTLGVRDCSWDNYLDEIRSLKVTGSKDFDWLNDIYEALDSESQSLMKDDVAKLRYQAPETIWHPADT